MIDEESSPFTELITRERRSKQKNDVQLPSSTPHFPEDREFVHRPGNELEGSAPPQDQSSTLAAQQGVPQETLPPIPNFPEDSSMGVEDDGVEVNEALMREQLLNRIHDTEISAKVDAAWNEGGVDAFVAETIEYFHFVRKSASTHVKSDDLVARLR